MKSQPNVFSPPAATIAPLPLIGRLDLPWPRRRNPRHQEHEHQARSFAIEIGLLGRQLSDPDVRRFNAFVEADSYSYPYCDLERLNVAGLFNQWLYFIDDRYDDHPEFGRDLGAVRALMERSLAVLGSGALPAGADPFDRLTRRVHETLVAPAGPHFRARFLDHVADYLFRGSLAAMELWARECLPTVEEYCELRLYDSALFAVFDVVEVATGVNLSDDVLESDAIRQLRLRAARHVAFANDLFSYQKEVLEHGMPFNLLHVIMKNERLGMAYALDRALDLINDDMDWFVHTAAQLPTFGADVDAQLPCYVDGLKAWMRGNVDFSLASPRFRTPNSPFLELRTDSYQSGNSID